MATQLSVKHTQISRTQSNLMIVIAVATVLSIFSLFAVRALIVKGLYQNRALNAKRQVVKQLDDNYKAVQKLISEYQIFADSNPNILGGTIDGQGNRDGDNSRIVLDALPSKYDAPALAASIEKILLGRNVVINSVDLKDDAVSNPDKPQAEPQTKAITFAFDSTANFNTDRKLIVDFERSIRAVDITSLELSGKNSVLQLTVNATTYFQPARSLVLEATKEVQ